jgi:WhiB family redox-sensing transcriptional regulator
MSKFVKEREVWQLFEDAQSQDARDQKVDDAGVVHPRFDEEFTIWGLFSQEVDLSWHQKALCAQTDPEIFFPEKGGSVREAKRVCQHCEVREQCLKYALDHDERFGIWGGLSERERSRIRRARA